MHGQQHFSCILLPSSLAALTSARDLIHCGWKLLHHPLYGNYRPYQQPYRTLIVSAPAALSTETPKDAAQLTLDEESLHFIEEALTVYSSCSVLLPENAPANLRDACAYLDFELMRLPLEQAGCLDGGLPELPRKSA